jgi:hypothetical protein
LGWKNAELEATAMTAEQLQKLVASMKTRQDLIRVFEYLSLVKLGAEARSRNHLALAAALGGSDPVKRGVASHLATSYELARYSPDHESLPQDILQTAQRELSFLAQVEAV